MDAERRPSIFENQKRSCTDWPCLLIFLVFLLFYILFAIFVFRQGSLSHFIYPTDTQGRICGVESQIDRQYLQFFDIIKCVKYVLIGARCPTLQMCVEECPSNFYHYKLLYAQELGLVNDKQNRIQQIRSQLSCEKSAQSQVNNPKISIYSLVKERRVCAPYAFPSIPFYGRCIPSVIVHALNATIKQADDIIKNRGGNSVDEDIIPTKDYMQNSLNYFKKALQIKRIISYMIDDLITSRYILLLSLVFALVALIAYMVLLRYVARWIIWTSLILCVIVFALAATFCFAAQIHLKNAVYNKNNTLNDLTEINITFNANKSDHDDIQIVSSVDLGQDKLSTIERFDAAMVLLEDFAPMSKVWLILGIVCCCICVILMICICCLYERISLAASLIEEASKAICFALTIFIWPVITFILNITFIILGILVLAYYSTLGHPIYQISCAQDFGQSCRIESVRSYVTADESAVSQIRLLPNSCFDYNEGDHCIPDDFYQLNCTTDRIQCVYVSYGFVDETFQDYLNPEWSHRFAQFLSQHSWIIHIFNLFVIYWLIAFSIALEEMVLACTFATYYWHMKTLNKKCCSGYFHKCFCFDGLLIAVRYHLGTIAFGSSIIAIIDTIRTLVDLLKDRLEAMNTTGYGRCGLRLIEGCLACVRCCFQFFSRYTYIMTAISGKWFCPSAFTATRLLLQNCLRVFVLDRVSAILLYIGRITITIGTCVFTAYLIHRATTILTLHFAWFPVLIIGIVVYVSSSIFLNVYTTATSTLFFCVLYDLELHDGSQIEENIMSNRLRNVLQKSNDFRNKDKFQTVNQSTINEKT